MWIISGDRTLSGAARDAFVDPENEVFLSAVSAWEIAIKHGLGKLPLPLPPALFVPKERARHDIAPLPLEESSAIMVGRLPDLHRDPFDRMLVCQAISGGLTLVTPDPLITQYPVQILW